MNICFTSSKSLNSSPNKALTLISGMAVISFLSYGGSASAIQITPTSVTASSTLSLSYSVNNLINNSGLSGGNHDSTFSNMWLNSSGSTANVTFDFGDVYDLTGTDIWQYNYTGVPNALNRGVQNFNILTSLDGTNFSSVGSGTLTKSTGGSIPSEFVAFSGTAQYVRFDITSNYGGSNVGLSEVKFQGTLAPTSVPEPLTILGSLTALGFGSVFKKKFKSSKS